MTGESSSRQAGRAQGCLRRGEHTLLEQSQVSEPRAQRGCSRPGEPEAGESGSVGNLSAGSSAARQSYQGLKRMFWFPRNPKANLPSESNSFRFAESA